MNRRVVLGAVLLAAAVCAAVPAPRALADADPASDYLLGAPAFYPFQPRTSTPVRQQLERALAALKARGLNLKVAIIENPTDLGAVPNLFGKPQAYATFLGQEISFNQPQPLLVVMPSGFGLSHVGPASALHGQSVDSAHKSDGMARSATAAVERLARANGKPISVSSAARSGSGSGVSPLITFGAPALIVVLGALFASRIRRRPRT